MSLYNDKHCICEVGEPCDYHAATCNTCPGGRCKGHPCRLTQETEPERKAEQAAEAAFQTG